MGGGGLLEECICGHKPEARVTLTTIREYGIGGNEIGGLCNAVTNFGAPEYSPVVFRIWEVPGPVFCPQVRYSDTFSWLSCQVCRYVSLKQTTTASFHILPNSHASAYTIPHIPCSGGFVVT